MTDTDHPIANPPNQHRPGLITYGECQFILNELLKEENQTGVVISYSLVPELDTVGNLCEYFHLNLVYQKKNEHKITRKSVFVKTMPYQNSDLFELLEKSEIFKKETLLYMGLINELKKLSQKIWCAQCYFVKPGLMVMQDIEELGYCPVYNAPRFLQKQEIKSILKSLAIMHASSLAFEKRNGVKINEMLPDAPLEPKDIKKAVWFSAGVRAVIEVILQRPRYQPQPIQDVIRTELPIAYDLLYTNINPSMKYCNVFCHHAIWSGNVFFSTDNPDGESAVFVNFQLGQYLPAAIDVSLTLYLNTRPVERKLIEADCYQFYYQQFAEALLSMNLDANDFITYEEFLNSIKDVTLFAALYNCVAATMLKVPADYLQEMKLNHPREFYQFIYVDRTDEIIQLMHDHSEFERNMIDTVEDLMAYLLKDKDAYRKKRRRRD